MSTDDFNPADLPKALADLPVSDTRSYDLTVSRAGELNIPVVGSVGGSANRRIVVLERVAYKDLAGTSGSRYHFGYAIRLCVTVNKWDANMKVSLPFLAASAQMGQVEAGWQLQVLGLAGRQISEQAIPPTELNVETFVLAKQSLTGLINAVNDSTTTFSPQRLLRIDSVQQRNHEFRVAAVKTFALSRIARKNSLDQAQKRLGTEDTVLSATVKDVYDIVAPGPADVRPGDQAVRSAMELLGGIEADM